MSAAKPADRQGHDTLQIISQAKAFNHWMFLNVAPDVRQPVLEIGSGIGNISSFLLDAQGEVVLSDIDPGYCSLLQEQFGQHPSLAGILGIDLADAHFASRYASQLNRFNSVIFLNVLEHIQHDQQAIRNAASLLKPGGRLIVLVPSYPFLYCDYDKNLGHYRRYTRSSFRVLFESAGLHIHRQQYFNFLGIAGWLVMGKLLRRQQLDTGSFALYNKLMPLNRFLDTTMKKIAGLSQLIVAEKPM